MSQTPKTGSVPVPKMRRGVKGFYRDVLREMKHVTWPKPHETTRLTGVVLVVCALIIVLLQFAAFVFGEIVTAIVKGGL
jgi:preprotein translocase SecE subunit